MNKYNIIAIDLAKNVFQVCKVSPQGKVLYNREVSRAKLKQLLIKEKLSLVSMEACSSAHYWARYAKEAGHQVKVINTRSVKGFQTRQKTDRNDTLAIATASSLDHIHSIRIQSVEEQAMQSMERARNLALTNQIRGKKVAAIALANKTVRTAYAILKNDLVYQPEKLA
ncbi:IS110 family transposase [Vibrio sp. MA40-2]|uniref:IS110 family transposase n=1 Tax=Vibrio sp. MA40-2 TaxID=3391828 RepID=UPI0039A68837